jgi:hypothetical protein
MSMIVYVIAVIAAIAAYSYYQRRFGRAANYSDMSKVYGLPAGEAPQTYIGGAFYSGPLNNAQDQSKLDKTLDWLSSTAQRERIVSLALTDKNRLAIAREQLKADGQGAIFLEPFLVLDAGTTRIDAAEAAFAGSPHLPTPSDGPKAPSTLKVTPMRLLRVSSSQHEMLVWCEHKGVDALLAWGQARY